MVAVCLYLFVHQPHRIKRYKIYDIGKDPEYFDHEFNKYIFTKVAQRSYLPTNDLLLHLIKKHGDRFKLSVSISGVALEQMEQSHPEVLQSFKKLASTGQVEFLAGTYYQSLSSEYSEREFKHQLLKHKELIEFHFNQSPKVIRNTGLLYNDNIAAMSSELGFKGMLVDIDRHVSADSDLSYLYSSSGKSNMTLFPKHIKLSEDISKRFSDRTWGEWPLTTEKFKQWIDSVNGGGDIINLFMPYEIFGEHHGKETGILDFLEHFPASVLEHEDNFFVTPSEALNKLPRRRAISIRSSTTESKSQGNLVDMWSGNEMQEDALRRLYELEKDLVMLGDEKLVEKWRKLSTSDHFFYMNTVSFRGGNEYKHNIYGSPYDAYLYYINALSDLKYQINMKKVQYEKEAILSETPSNRPEFSDIKSQVNLPRNL